MVSGSGSCGIGAWLVDFSALGGGVAAFRQCAGEKVLGLYLRFGGERFFRR